MNKQTQEALKMAIDALEFEGLGNFEACMACKEALHNTSQEQNVTNTELADFLDDVADAIAYNDSETLRHKASWLRSK